MGSSVGGNKLFTSPLATMPCHRPGAPATNQLGLTSRHAWRSCASFPIPAASRWPRAGLRGASAQWPRQQRRRPRPRQRPGHRHQPHTPSKQHELPPMEHQHARRSGWVEKDARGGERQQKSKKAKEAKESPKLAKTLKALKLAKNH